MKDDTREVAGEADAVSEIPTALTLANLPTLKQPLGDGLYGGVITLADGRNYAVAWLHNAKPPKRRLDADAARAWAKSIGAQLITRAIGSLLVSTLGELLPQEWVWTCEDYAHDSACAWYCYLYDGGGVDYGHRSFERGAVAVRLIPLVP